MADGTFAGLLGSMDADVNRRGRQFERVVRWWLGNVPVNPFAPHRIEDVWLWDEWPDRPGPDIGIDLVARLSDGSLCAVQAKCIDEAADIPKSQLDSFVSAASTAVFAHRLLVATTDGLSANARRMLQDQHVIRVMRTELEDSLTVWPATVDLLDQPVTQPKWGPRPHQQDAIHDVVNGLKTAPRGQLIMACGTGKTLTALWTFEQLEPGTTLVLVPSLSLLSQTLSEWAKHTRHTWTYICVCSDDTVNKQADQPISTVDDFPFEVTTDPDRIARFLDTPGRKVVFSTYQSSAQVATALRTTAITIDLAICDEAHRLTGKTDADYATILDDTKIPAVRRLFMTATPRTYTATTKKTAEERGVEITSMDDHDTYGPVLHTLSFGRAIELGLLSDYRVVIVGVTDPQVQELIDRRELVTVNDDIDTDARTLAAHIGLAKATKDYNLTRTISFHSRINTAATFAADHPKILEWLPDTYKPDGTTWTGTISGTMNTAQRRRILQQLRNDQPDRHALLTNARCLTEGIDVPTLDGIAFIDPRSSQIDIIQAVGRAIRKSANKQTGYIILPVLIPTTANIEDDLDDTAFKPVWAVLKALRSHDELLGSQLDDLRIALGRGATKISLPSKIVLSFPQDIDRTFPRFASMFSISLVETGTNSWNWWFGRLSAFAERHGHSSPNSKSSQTRTLAGWVNDQRMSHKGTRSTRLSPDQRAKLESLPNWLWNPYDTAWHSNYEKLLRYVETRKSLEFTRGELFEGVSLAHWVMRQRAAYSSHTLDEYKKTLLEKVPSWEWSPRDARWALGLQKLQSFRRASHGADPLPDDVHDGFRVGSWVVQQRVRYRSGRLTADQIQRLEELENWTWEPFNLEWTNKFNATMRFALREGHLKVSQRHSEDGLLIGQWIAHQRVCFRKGDLSHERVRLIETIPGWTWDPVEDAWMGKFHDLEKLLRVGPGTAMSRSLRNWCSEQRSSYVKGKLDDQKISLLESLDSWTWDPLRTAWEDGFQILTKYVRQHGNARIPHGLVFDGFRLGGWVLKQRQRFTRKTIQPDQVKRLEALSGWVWIARRDK